MGIRFSEKELLATAVGTPIVNFSLPIDIGYGDKKETMWVRCAYFGERAQNVAEYLVKGKGVQVVGEYRMPSIYDGKNGQAVNMELNVQQLNFVGGNTGNGNASQPTQASEDVGESIPF